MSSQIRSRITEDVTRRRLRLELRRARGAFGLWIALLAAALLAFALLLHELHLPAPWASQYSFEIGAPDATGVAPSDEVRIAGVEVGHVTAVGLHGNRPAVTVSIDPKYEPIYRDARVVIRPNTPLQDMYVDIVSRGTPPAGAVRNGQELAAAQTESPVQIGAVIDIFDAAVRPRVTAAIDALGQGLGDHGVQLREALVELAPFLRDAQRLAQETATRQLETARLVHNFALLSGELASRTTALRGIVRDGATTFERLASVDRPLGALIQELPATLRAIPASFSTLDAASAQLAPAARSLLPVAASLRPALAALRGVSPVGTAALARLEPSLSTLTGLLGRATPVFTALGRAFAELRPQAPELDHVSAAVLPCEQAVSDFFQWTLSVSKLGTDEGDMQRGIAVFGPQSAVGLLTPQVNGNLGLLRPVSTCSGVAAGP